MSAPIPHYDTTFVGREDLLGDVLAHLATPGLLTLLGPGGVGKTRLVCQLGEVVQGQWPGGVRYFDLSGARDEEGVVAVACEALGVRPGADAANRVAFAIEGAGRTLLILDNFEQLVEHAPDTVSAWMGRAADARFLVTSRVLLGLAGEQVVDLSACHYASYPRRVGPTLPAS